MDLMNNKNKVIALYFSILLSSCASGDIYSELIKNIQILLSEPKDISSDKVASIPYASMQARLGRSQNTLLILEEEKEGVLKWTSSNFVKVYTKNGLIVKAKGLDNELEIIDLDKNHPIIKGFSEIDKKVFLSFYTFNNPKLFRLPVKTEISFLKEEEIIILGTAYKVKLYEEISLKNLISWEFKNLYWVDESGYIVKSVQNFTPKNPEIHTLITKKYKMPD